MTGIWSEEVVSRFNAKWRKAASGCWLWTAATVHCGYGCQRVKCPDGKFRALRANRLSWEIHRGSIPAGMVICHRCDVPACVNPDHLFVGTRKENSRDMVNKGRSRVPSSQRDTHPRAKVTSDQVAAMRVAYAAGAATQYDLAARYGLAQSSVWAIIRGKTWST